MADEAKEKSSAEIAAASKEDGYAAGLAGALFDAIKERLHDFYFWIGWKAGDEKRQRDAVK